MPMPETLANINKQQHFKSWSKISEREKKKKKGEKVQRRIRDGEEQNCRCHDQIKHSS